MNWKNWTLIAVVAALVAWAGVETQRLVVAKKQLAASLELQKTTLQHVAMVRLKYADSFAGKK